MTFLEKINVLERLDQLIRMKATGSPCELADRLGVARSTVYEIVSTLNALGGDVAYNKIRKSYEYASQKKLHVGYI